MKKIGLIAGASFLAGAVFFALSFGFLQRTADRGTTLGPEVAQAQAARMKVFAPFDSIAGSVINLRAPGVAYRELASVASRSGAS